MIFDRYSYSLALWKYFSNQTVNRLSLTGQLETRSSNVSRSTHLQQFQVHFLTGGDTVQRRFQSSIGDVHICGLGQSLKNVSQVVVQFGRHHVFLNEHVQRCLPAQIVLDVCVAAFRQQQVDHLFVELESRSGHM